MCTTIPKTHDLTTDLMVKYAEVIALFHNKSTDDVLLCLWHGATTDGFVALSHSDWEVVKNADMFAKLQHSEYMRGESKLRSKVVVFLHACLTRDGGRITLRSPIPEDHKAFERVSQALFNDNL